MISKKLDSNFLNYLIEKQVPPGEKLPSLNEIGNELGISVGKLREQLEVARNLGLVSVKPRIGIHRQQFTVAPALLQNVLFGLATKEASFEQYSRLRRAVETSFWQDAVVLLTKEDKDNLKAIVANAWQKLRGEPVHIPNSEHRQLHMAIFKRLENPFVQGIISTYWEAYEASELTRFVTYQYWIDVWMFHERIVESLCQNEFDQGRKLLIEHFALLPKAP